ncbi:MAG TPA: hypothetical protein VF796_24475 [Humisphaera sp.]
MLTPIKKTFNYGAHTVTLETGEIARQSGGAVMVNMDDTVVLATVVAKTEAKPGQDFFPLTVDYVEKVYAAGRIPGGDRVETVGEGGGVRPRDQVADDRVPVLVEVGEQGGGPLRRRCLSGTPRRPGSRIVAPKLR